MKVKTKKVKFFIFDFGVSLQATLPIIGSEKDKHA